MVKIRVIIISSVNIFTIDETVFENVIIILPSTHQKKTKVPGLFIRSGKLYQLYKSYFSIIFGGTA